MELILLICSITNVRVHYGYIKNQQCEDGRKNMFKWACKNFFLNIFFARKHNIVDDKRRK
jgi:hypothetical protein